MAKTKNSKIRIQALLERPDVSVTANIEENYIITTEDKIRILYNEYNEARKYSGEFWTFLGLFVALLTTILTCEFKSILGVSEFVFEAIFILATAIALVLTIWAGIQWGINHQKLTFDHFINQIRGNNSDDKN